MKIFSMALLLISTLSVQAHHLTGVQREDPSYRAAGNLVLFVAVPKENRLKLYLVGREAAELRLGNRPKLISISLVGPGWERHLPFHQIGNYYEISGFYPGQAMTLEMKA